MSRVLISCSLLYNNLAKSWTWSFIVKWKSTVVKITKIRHKIKNGLGLNLKLGLGF